MLQVRNTLPNPTSTDIQREITKTTGVVLDESTIRGRLIALGFPLSKQTNPTPTVTSNPAPTKPTIKNGSIRQYSVPDAMKKYVPGTDQFKAYVVRPVDDRLAAHYEAGKTPLTQGKQGTGKTLSHMYYAYRSGLPFFLFSCHEDMKLHKLFGDKTIENGSIKFKEGEFVRAIQCPSVILFDEINAISNANTFDFHALLQNRELFVKDADNGNGRWYKLHPDCKIGFAQNPKSSKYIGGCIKPSNFLGRCTFITYPEFEKKQIIDALIKKHPDMGKDEAKKYQQFFTAVCQAVDKAELPIDISIRQLFNLIDLRGMGLKESIEDSILSMLDAVSQPAAKEAIFKLAQSVWIELLPPEQRQQPKNFMAWIKGGF
jgi:hypothetical protein